MDKTTILSRIIDSVLVPIIRVPTADAALAIAGALRDGGIGIIEITMTVPGALRVIERLADECGDDVLLGALEPSPDDVDRHSQPRREAQRSTAVRTGQRDGDP